MIFLQLFLVFIQIGIFGFGGGYSMISLIQGQVVTQYHWMTMQDFDDSYQQDAVQIYEHHSHTEHFHRSSPRHSWARRSCRLALDEPRKLLISCRSLAILYLYRALPCHLLWCQVCRHQPHPHDMLLCFCRIAIAVLTEINFSETERTFNISMKE